MEKKDIEKLNNILKNENEKLEPIEKKYIADKINLKKIMKFDEFKLENLDLTVDYKRKIFILNLRSY